MVVERKDHAAETGMVFFLLVWQAGKKTDHAVRGAKKAPPWKGAMPARIALDTVLSIFSVTYPYLRGKSRTVPICAELCQFYAIRYKFVVLHIINCTKKPRLLLDFLCYIYYLFFRVINLCSSIKTSLILNSKIEHTFRLSLSSN